MTLHRPDEATRERVGAVVVAAGSGSRLTAAPGMSPRAGSEAPTARRGNKVLLDLGGRPIVAHAVLALARAVRLDALVIVARDEDRDAIAAALATESGLPALTFAPGGKERPDSVQNGLAALDPRIDLVLVHDAARPFPPPELVRAVLERARADGAAVPVLPVTDTLKRVAGGVVRETVPRADLVGAQTPQGFRTRTLLQALRTAGAGADGGPTDDAGWLERIGAPVATVPGDPRNLKITTPFDLEVARALLPAFSTAVGSAGAKR